MMAFQTKLIPGMSDKQRFSARDLYNHKNLGIFSGYLPMYVHPGDVQMLKITFMLGEEDK